MPVARAPVRVSAVSPGLLLFPALVGRRALGPAQPSPRAPPPPARGPVPARESECGHPRCPIHQMQRAERGDKGFDGHKKIQGRQRQLLVDTGGLQLATHVGPANENDRTGGQAALQNCTTSRLNAWPSCWPTRATTGSPWPSGRRPTAAGGWKRPRALAAMPPLPPSQPAESWNAPLIAMKPAPESRL